LFIYFTYDLDFAQAGKKYNK